MLPDTPTLTVFVTAALVMLITPGPAVTYIVARSVDQGRTAGLLTVLGIQTGVLFHIAAATLGLSGILLSSSLAYGVVKYAGTAYLIYLGVQKFREKDGETQSTRIARRSLSQTYRDGIIVALLNPKTALFFFAFLPQFVNVSKGNVPGQIFLLGIIFLCMATITDGSYAIAAGTAGKWLRNHRGFLRTQRYFAGSMYIGLGLFTALADVRRSK